MINRVCTQVEILCPHCEEEVELNDLLYER